VSTVQMGRRRWALLAGVVALGLMAGPASIAAGQQPQGATTNEGVLALTLGSGGDTFTYTPSTGPVETQAITKQGCKATLAVNGDILVTLAPLPSTRELGLFDDGLGVKLKGSGGNGQPCGRVDGPDEGLVMALAGILADKEISRAELDIEAKFDAAVEAELYLDGAKVADADPLLTGTLSDSGPDSADGDNYRWVIDEGVVFDEVRLTVSADTPSGSFALAGGADGTAPGSLGITGSAWQLVESFDGIIDCGQATFTTGDGVTTPEATFTRADDDVKNPDPCSTLIGYNLESTAGAGVQTVTFEFETAEAPSWFGEFVWAPEPAVVPVPATLVDLDGDGTGETTLVWCDGFSGVDVATGNPLPVMPAGESWCLIAQTSTLVGTATIQVTQSIFGLTDPDFIRPN